MHLYEKVLQDKAYFKTVEKIESIRFITDGKWDWEHGLGHYKRVLEYIKQILEQLKVDERTMELGMVAAILHDIGLSKGDKVDHALEGSQIFTCFTKNIILSNKEEEMVRQAILDHSKGNNIESTIGLALLLADKLDVTYHRVINSSVQDEINKEFGKIKKVGIQITEEDLTVTYQTEPDFNINILQNWPKTITIPKKVADYLGKKYIFIQNGKEIDVASFLESFGNQKVKI